MLLEQKVEQIKLTPSQQVIYEYLMNEKEKIKKKNVKIVSKETYTSPATVTRFAQALGYSGFEELKEDYLNELRYINTHFSSIDVNYPFTSMDNIQKIASKIALVTKETIDDTLELVDHDSLQKAIKYLLEAKMIHYFGLSYNLALGYIFQMDMTRIGKYVNVWDRNGEQLFLPSVVSKDDCVIFVSYTAKTKNRMIPIEQIKKQGAKIIVITSLGENDYIPFADVVLRMTTREKIHSKIKSYSTETSLKYLLDLLYSCVYACHYDENNQKRINACAAGEVSRESELDVMKE